MSPIYNKSTWVTVERSVVFVVYLVLVLVPLVNIFLRPLRIGILGIDNYLSHTLLLLGFLGAITTGREGRHLTIGTTESLPKKVQKYTKDISGAILISLLTCLTISAISMVLIAFSDGGRVGFIPMVVIVSIIPFSYMILSTQCIARLSHKRGIIAVSAILVGMWFSLNSVINLLFLYMSSPPAILDTLFSAHLAFFSLFKIPFVVIIVCAAFFGLPLFATLGGIAMVLFSGQGVDLSIVPLEGYNMLTNQAIPAIPLFALAGYILSESNASERLVRVFRNFLGWLPGGLVVTAIVASVFFTSFTGASGVTILALGGLLFPMLMKEENISERHSIGILTSSSNIGLLFPPSLAIILYGTIAQINIFHIFLGGIFPGILILIIFSIFGVLISLSARKRNHDKIRTFTFNAREAFSSLRSGIFELLMPVVVVVIFFSGIATLIESAAIAVLYAFVVAVFIKKDISLRDIPKVFGKCAVIIGGVLFVLASARALSYFIIDAQVPSILSEWVRANISSRFVFLIILNAVLLITGCFMDIFSAILIVAPLVIPLGDIFSIHPVHLGIIFLANLGVGFITPPVGLDLFLASYRFKKSLTKVYRYVVPFFIIELIMVIVITYVPQISTFMLRFAERGGGY